MVHRPQRQRHGPTKNIVEGVGGAIVGAALVLLLGDLLAKRPHPRPSPKAEGGSTAPGEKESEA
jgi:hypothetical protein